MKKSPIPLGFKIGILGGGQLARMLVTEGTRLGFEMHVLSSFANDPAAQVTRFWQQGDISEPYALKDFYRKVNVVTIESEFVDHKLLLEAEAASHTATQPKPLLISEFSDRLKQKTWLERFKIPTSPFVGLLQAVDAEKFFAAHPQGVVFKKRRFGYDGYGTFIVKTKAQLKTWLLEHSLTAADFIAEEFIPFQKELALQVAVTAKKEILFYPLVEWQAQDSKCLWVKGPAQGKGGDGLKKKIAKALIDSQYVGLFAVEMFATRNGLVVNEIAPRVHNSGHYTIEAFSLNQFQAHLLAIAGVPLPTTLPANAKGFAMLNLLGTSDQKPELSPGSEAALHWYGKAENRKGRKMGHLTALNTTPERALKSVLKDKKYYRL